MEVDVYKKAKNVYYYNDAEFPVSVEIEKIARKSLEIFPVI